MHTPEAVPVPPTPVGRGTSPWIFLPLVAPFGVVSGYAVVTLAFQLSKAGLPAAAVTALVALSVWPQTLKVFWAPLVDTLLGPRRWYAIGAVASGLSLLALSTLPVGARNTPVIALGIVVASIASSLVSMSSEVFMAHDVAESRKGAVSGWSQAGNLGGQGLGGGLGLFLAQHAPAAWMSGAGLLVLCLACIPFLALVRETPRAPRVPRLFESLREVGGDLWAVTRSRAGLLAAVLMLLPIGAGGAQGAWSAIAHEWRADADTVALVNGVLGGVASLLGAVAGGFACDRLDRRTAYCLFGLLLAAVAAAMALSPRTREVFVASTLAYAFVLGACYAGYSAVVLEAIGKGAAATKFNLLASISNVPIAALTAVEGTLHDRMGSSGMLLVGEGLLPLACVVAFAGFAELTRNRRRPRGWSLRVATPA